MEQYNVTGMSCAACSAKVEKAVGAVDGVKSCSVNLLTSSMAVEGTASSESIIDAVTEAGYGASLKNEKFESTSENDLLKDTETPKLNNRLLWSTGFIAVLMYFSMGHTTLNFAVPPFFENNPTALGLFQLILAAIVMVLNQRFFISGFRGVIHKAPNMDTLVAMGSSAAFVYSTCILFKMTATGENLLHELYFESAAMILALITVGKMLEARSKGKTTDALKSLMKLSPDTAVVEREGKELVIPSEQVQVGDVFIIRSGQTIPVDGIILDGNCSVDEQSLTGESVPADKTEGENVFAGTVNKSGFAKCRATKTGEDTTLSKIIKTVSDAAATKAPVAQIADKVSGVFVPVVITIAVAVTIIWLITGKDTGFALARGISVLVISCPCALGLATPVAIMVGSGVGAKNGILFKSAVALEQTGKVSTVVLDKTGTVTEGKSVVTDIVPSAESDETELLSVAYALEYKSEHPLSRAVVNIAEEVQIPLCETTEFVTHTGKGIEAKLDGKTIAGGKYEFLTNYAGCGSLDKDSQRLADEGKTPLLFAENGKLLGIIAVADTVKSDSADAVAELHAMGINVVMLTGDNEKTAAAIGRQVGVDNVIAGVLPEGKEEEIRKLQKNGTVAMVGDGINDSPALMRADIGIAIGAGADIAIDSAEVVLMNSRLSDVSAAIRLSRETLKNIKQNLFWAFLYNLICIPVAAGVLIPFCGIELNPMIAAAAMSLSSFCVVTNALRLNLVKIKKVEINNIKQNTEEKTMEKTVKIEGMMCPHCEARVKQTLETLTQVDEAVVSHEKGTAVLKLNADLSDSAIKSVIEGQGYKVI